MKVWKEFISNITQHIPSEVECEIKMMNSINSLTRFANSHIHQNAWLSGVFYINVPKSKNKDGGSIKFTSKGFDYSMKKNETIEKIINPAKGDLVLFPSSLFHQTIPFNSDDERICLAFDMMPIF